MYFKWSDCNALLCLWCRQVAFFSVVKGPFYPEFKQCYAERSALNRLYNYFVAVSTFFLPVIVLFYVYTAIIFNIRSKYSHSFDSAPLEDRSAFTTLDCDSVCAEKRKTMLTEAETSALREAPKQSDEELPKGGKRLMTRLLCLHHDKAANSRLISPRETPSDNSTANRSKTLGRALRKSTLMSLFIVLAYILSWFPCVYRMFSSIMVSLSWSACLSVDRPPLYSRVMRVACISF